MIDLYMWSTTNSRRASIGLEEAGLEYVVHPINIQEGEQKTPEHTARNPYQKVPVIVDSDGPDGAPITVFESGAILLYLAEKTGKLYGADARDRVEVQKWFIMIMNATLPIMGALRTNPPLVPNAERVLGVLDGRLGENEFFASEFSIADLAFYPRVANWESEHLSLDPYANILRWREDVGARPAIQRGWAQPG
ncbi:MAG: glutathione S-transferase N-terminal domain-containing protein [Alphaproteobacteria bacterium]|nr:glutathione S-transferase N-terminal domain-containing protein [Alphaproteobacteria bacterium]